MTTYVRSVSFSTACFYIHGRARVGSHPRARRTRALTCTRFESGLLTCRMARYSSLPSGSAAMLFFAAQSADIALIKVRSFTAPNRCHLHMHHRCVVRQSSMRIARRVFTVARTKVAPTPATGARSRARYGTVLFLQPNQQAGSPKPLPQHTGIRARGSQWVGENERHGGLFVGAQDAPVRVGDKPGA